MARRPARSPTRPKPILRLLGVLLLMGASSVGAQATAPELAALRTAVEAAERAFARSMAERDLDAFTRHLAADAIFFGPGEPLRGRDAVVEGWRGFFAEPAAPFSWEPDQIEVLADGTLAHSSGPVRDATGSTVTRFNSIWRREADGTWRVVFDRGDPRCDCRPKPPPTDAG